jgi:hypothetical protein
MLILESLPCAVSLFMLTRTKKLQRKSNSNLLYFVEQKGNHYLKILRYLKIEYALFLKLFNNMEKNFDLIPNKTFINYDTFNTQFHIVFH